MPMNFLPSSVILIIFLSCGRDHRPLTSKNWGSRSARLPHCPPLVESNLSPKPPKHGATPSRKTQEKARRCNTMTYLEKSAGWRFESSPVHHFFSVSHCLSITLPVC